jgi:predicted GNAT family acetyltransferase
MRVGLHAWAEELLAKAQQALRADPFSTSVIAVAAARIVAGTEAARGQDLWATVEDGDGRVVGLAMHTPPHRLFLSRMPGAAAVALADALADMGRELPGVNGAVESTAAFAKAWKGRTGQASRMLTAMRMYRLGELVVPRNIPGEARRAAAPGDVDLVAEWFAAFHDEVQPHAPARDWAVLAKQRATSGEVVLWQTADGRRALAGVSPPVAGVARVGPVYTPPRWRKHGYGSAVAAAATASGSRAGAQHIVLYTDLANPTSNAIYQAIGYRADHDAEERAFH